MGLCLYNLGVIPSMNASFIGSQFLATGQNVPFTGSWVNISDARNAMIVVLGSGITSSFAATLQSKTVLNNVSPAVEFADSGIYSAVNFYTFNAVNNGYSDPTFLDTPMSQIRIVVPTGSGKVYSYVTYQN
jgi:hypothetical protein